MQPVVARRGRIAQGCKLWTRCNPSAFRLGARQRRGACGPVDAPATGFDRRCNCAGAVIGASVCWLALLRSRFADESIGIGIAGVFVIALDQQPLRLATALLRGAHQLPPAMEFFSMQREIDLALGHGFERIASGTPDAMIKDVDVAGAIVAGRNVAFEGRVTQRMIFDLDRQPLLSDTQRRTFRHRPALQNALHLQAEVVVPRARMVQLHHEDGTFAALVRHRIGRLRGVDETPLAGVFAQAHAGLAAGIGRVLCRLAPRCLGGRFLRRRFCSRFLAGHLLLRRRLG